MLIIVNNNIRWCYVFFFRLREIVFKSAYNYMFSLFVFYFVSCLSAYNFVHLPLGLDSGSKSCERRIYI